MNFASDTNLGVNDQTTAAATSQMAAQNKNLHSTINTGTIGGASQMEEYTQSPN